ncbi:nuclear transport factor 2 family protein [Erysipelotrichaceae bacterium RD49]|nr:nuclear transport factor 2 family protein [Erysipelotrichaceae bacterium RD49]
MSELENKLEISFLVDEISYQLDQKDAEKALEAFTEDAVLNIEEDGHTITSLCSNPAILTELNKRLEFVNYMFHNNGTKNIQVISLDQKATADTSCIIKMASNQATTDEDVYFHDKLIKVNGYWYIVERTIEIITKSIH